MKSLSIALLGLFTSFAVAQQTGLPSVQLTIGDKHLTAEVASSPKQREIGLMHRTSIPQNGGMLFVFNTTGEVCMWMENTLIPLSVAFITQDGTILHIDDMQPKTRNLHCSVMPVRYALEMNLGWFKKNGIQPGATLKGLPK